MTFGIITKDNEDYTHKLIQSIHNLEIPEYEIIVVGGRELDEKWIYFDEDECIDCITLKKNIITENAKYDIIVYLHDYFIFTKKWYKEFIKFGNDWDIQLNPILRPDKQRYLDWMQGYMSEDYIFKYKDYDEVWDSESYISGAYFIAKKWVMQLCSFDETLKWRQGDDIEWSKLLHKNNIKIKFNKNSIIKTQYNKFNHLED